ncbi:MAG TPA: hypothetical protein VFY53_03750 [Rhodoplanes sp.]|nr:hypothetical protein [Rhodoplanes sp.]
MRKMILGVLSAAARSGIAASAAGAAAAGAGCAAAAGGDAPQTMRRLGW